MVEKRNPRNLDSRIQEATGIEQGFRPFKHGIHFRAIDVRQEFGADSPLPVLSAWHPAKTSDDGPMDGLADFEHRLCRSRLRQIQKRVDMGISISDMPINGNRYPEVTEKCPEPLQKLRQPLDGNRDIIGKIDGPVDTVVPVECRKKGMPGLPEFGLIFLLTGDTGGTGRGIGRENVHRFCQDRLLGFVVEFDQEKGVRILRDGESLAAHKIEGGAVHHFHRRRVQGLEASHSLPQVFQIVKKGQDG